MSRLLRLGLILLAFHSGYSARILFLFGGANYSHKLAVWPLVIGLANKGHNVTFVSSAAKQPSPSPQITDITPSFLFKATNAVYNVDRIQDRKDGKESIFSNYEPTVEGICDQMLNSHEDPAFDELINPGKFDLVVINSILGDCAYFLAHRIGAKYLTFDTSTVYNWFYGVYSLQIESSWIPDLMTLVPEAPMSFWSRVKSTYTSYVYYRNTAYFEQTLRAMYMKRYSLTEAPELVELQRNTALVLVNSHYSYDFPRALPPMFVNVGGMQVWDQKGELPKHVKSFMDSYEDGSILISFGSTIVFNTLSEVYLNMFFDMMRTFDKVGFIWRWEGPLPETAPKNLLAEKWLPQTQILREKSLRALMTHCGINSIQEATYHGVPLIAMPLFADQDYNAYRIMAHEVGVRVEAVTLSAESLYDAVLSILRNPQYKKNVVIRSKHFRDRPNPTETAVEAVEFVLRHDEFSAMKPMEMNQSYWVRQHLDVHFFLFCVLLAINILIPYTIYTIIKTYFWSNSINNGDSSNRKKPSNNTKIASKRNGF